LGAHTVLADASSPVSFQESLHRSGSGLFDLVVNTCNVPGTEAASILAAKQGGRILFFNMATDFSRAVLSAEGIGREVEMVMGNGFASGHWQYALDLVRRNRDVWKFF
jgi:L-erythro-3,5-diaminohexanoate dehydrogenase